MNAMLTLSSCCSMSRTTDCTRPATVGAVTNCLIEVVLGHAFHEIVPEAANVIALILRFFVISRIGTVYVTTVG